MSSVNELNQKFPKELHVQRFLKKNSLQDLTDKYGIKVKEHEHFIG